MATDISCLLVQRAFIDCLEDSFYDPAKSSSFKEGLTSGLAALHKFLHRA